MIEPDYEALGRYHHLARLASEQARSRQALLRRLHAVLGNALDAGDMTLPAGCAARKVNFDALERLLGEAKQADATLRATLQQLGEIAPLADMPPLSLTNT